MSGTISGLPVHATAGARLGHNRITHTAIRTTLEALTARAFRVDRSNVSAELKDDAGKLGVSVSVKLALPPLLEPRIGSGTVFDMAQSARADVVSRGVELTGLEIGRVDIRLVGGHQEQQRKRRVA
ncbi:MULTISPECIES: hypothetical protein [Micrococcaceae]|jgi:hypothetical protein|uniref:Uncharacterized protein n=1 Tax=Paenarthrobacter aurescens (strain TC1) TaxID=290340 RepID=A1RBJ6_PAEAT|nr:MULTISPECIES: hypothetical protein [Micrococcaceae]ABM06906.1 hypothetical protein AAur_3933 [Paenarthrobacter aurescens TC1]AFR30947.1 hypothetical protein ARUE_c40750 [Arthrobacter sp. Rue61a]MBP2268513.1 hypothetical protein [Pseudarthrobacter sp. PvP004]